MVIYRRDRDPRMGRLGRPTVRARPRQHRRAGRPRGVYRKSGLRSRAELSAFFLEDLLLLAGER
jgi:hypothetical protein